MYDKDALKDAVLKSWDIILEGLAKEKNSLKFEKNEWKIESRSKLKSLSLVIREKEDPSDAVLHLVKYAEYMLPRSNLTATLTKFLTVIEELRGKYGNNPEKLREVVAYVIGYMLWSVDSVCNIFTIAEKNLENELKNMIGLEMSLIGAEPKTTDEFVSKLMDWNNKVKENKRGGDRR